MGRDGGTIDLLNRKW